MNVDSALTFNNQHYQPIYWADVLKKIYAEHQLVLANHGCLILPLSDIQQKLTLQTQRGRCLIYTNEFQRIPHEYLNSVGLQLVQYDDYLHGYDLDDLPYYQICDEVWFHALQCVRTIFDYTVLHLRQRIAAGKRLTQYSVIQQEIAAIYADLKLLTAHQACSLPALNHDAGIMLHCLHRLARLAGARAILAGHTLELLTQLQLFQQLYLTEIV